MWKSSKIDSTFSTFDVRTSSSESDARELLLSVDRVRFRVDKTGVFFFDDFGGENISDSSSSFLKMSFFDRPESSKYRSISSVEGPPS